MNTLHPHPRNPTITVFGQLLEPGEILETTDVKDGEKGWEPVKCPGLPVQEGHMGIFVRPAKQLQQCTANIPVVHDQREELLVDPENNFQFVRMSCPTCRQWLGDRLAS